METLNGKELSEAKGRAREIRIRIIRRRITCCATVMVAVFSGAIFFRSLEQQAGSTAADTSALNRSEDGEEPSAASDLITRVSSAFGGESGDEGSTAPATTPLTTSQS